MNQNPQGTGSDRVIWIEAETAPRHSFPGSTMLMVNDQPKCSGLLCLRADKKEGDFAPGELPLYAEFDFQSRAAGKVNVWVLSTPWTEGWVSPGTLTLDQEKPRDLSARKYSTSVNDWMFWTLAGDYQLAAGKHTVRVEVTGVRKADDRRVCYLDAFLITPDLDYVPAEFTSFSKLNPSTVSDLRQAIGDAYRAYIEVTTCEDLSEENYREVEAKILARPVRVAKVSPVGFPRFGLHGLDSQFFGHTTDAATARQVYDLLARVGVQSYRVPQACWHRLVSGGKTMAEADYRDFDFLVANANRNRQSFLLTVGYPPAEYTVRGSGLSPMKPGTEATYREYVRAVLKRVERDNATVDFYELGNEVDAGFLWYVGGTPELYLSELKVWREELNQAGVGTPLIAFGGLTWSRDVTEDGWGIPFVKRCFELGIADLVDGYSIHYTWAAAEKSFVEFVQSMIETYDPGALLINSEEVSYGHPSEILKSFARDLFLYDMARVDYYLFKDWYEGSNAITSGLFDLDMQPKLRLLLFALSVDAMDGRVLTGMAEPAKGVEAYVLTFPKANDYPAEPRTSIIIWYRDPAAPESVGLPSRKLDVPNLAKIRIRGFNDVTSACTWRLDPIDPAREYDITALPLVVFCNSLPDWKLIDRREFIQSLPAAVRTSEALLPATE